MTDAHAKAVEVAYRAACTAYVSAFDERRQSPVKAAITAYLAAIRAEGWVLVRDVGEKEIPTMPFVFSQARGVELIPQRSTPQEGWNACRAAMLGGTDDER